MIVVDIFICGRRRNVFWEFGIFGHIVDDNIRYFLSSEKISIKRDIKEETADNRTSYYFVAGGKSIKRNLKSNLLLLTRT